jgi:hypothetical protein
MTDKMTMICGVATALALSTALAEDHWWDRRVDAADQALSAAGIRLAIRRPGGRRRRGAAGLRCSSAPPTWAIDSISSPNAKGPERSCRS